jgi:gliding motility-associated-like protein
MPLDILDAASSTENGLDNKVDITGLTISKSCQSATGSAQIRAIYPGSGDIRYTLDNTVTNTTGLFANIASGRHHIQAVAPGGGCYTDTSFTIEASYNLITAISKTNPDNCAGIAGSITINASAANGAVTYTLLNTGVSQSIGQFNDLRGGRYNFRVSNTNGCSKDTSIALVENIPVGGCNDIFIPNAFTPNYDGKNDLFTVSLPSSFKNVTLQVFNRWGNIACEARGNTILWDGSYKGIQQPVGIYVYTLVFTDPNGMQKNIKGSLTLIR